MWYDVWQKFTDIWWYMLFSLVGLKMEAEGSFEMLENFYHIACC